MSEGIISTQVDFKNFNWKAAAFVFSVCGFALLFWLQAYFVTKERYERDRTADQDILKEMRAEQKEMRSDIKELLRKK